MFEQVAEAAQAANGGKIRTDSSEPWRVQLRLGWSLARLALLVVNWTMTGECLTMPLRICPARYKRSGNR